MKKFVVLGGTGEMGRFVVKDLFESCKDCEIIIGARDFNEVKRYAKSFNSRRVISKKIDVTNVKQTAKLLKNISVCINCVNYYFNLDVMKACLLARCHYLDLGGLYHMTKKQLKLNNQFKKKKLIAILGCGSTPGITNIMIAHASKFFDKIESIDIRFGGYDWTKYKQHFVLPYTAYTLFDEFIDQPIVFKDGKIFAVKPMTGKDYYNFPKPVGKQSCFYTLHSELATIPNNYKNKRLKNCSFRVCFPEDFVHDVNLLIELGFASKQKIKIGNVELTPRDFAAKELNREALPKNVKIKDMEFIWVDLIGIKKGRKIKMSIYTLTKSNPKWNAPAGSVDTAVPPSIIAQMIANKQVKKYGVLPPEKCINPKVFFKELRKRNIKIVTSTSRKDL